MKTVAKQFFGLFLTELGIMLRRPRHFLLAFVGFAVVAFVLVALLAVVGGLRQIAEHTGSPSVAIVMSRGAESAAASSLPATATGIVAGMPGVASAAGHPVIAAELLTTAKLPQRGTGVEASVLVRGVGSRAFELTPELAVKQGRQFHSGTNEIIAGSVAARAFRWLSPGSIVRFAKAHWEVVGKFSADAGYQESEIWTGLHALQSALNAEGRISIVLVRLKSPAGFSAFREAVSKEQRFKARAVRQSDYYAEQTEFLARFVKLAVGAIAVMLGACALLGIMNVVSTAFLSRTHELAVYRAIGFQRAAVIIALAAEIIVVGLAAGFAGGLCAAFVFDQYQAVTSTGTRQLAFQLVTTPATIGVGVGYAMGIGFFSALIPAYQAGRQSISKALKAA